MIVSRVPVSSLTERLSIRLPLVLLAAVALSSCQSLAEEAPAADSPSSQGMYVSIRDIFLGPETFPTPIEGLRHLGLDTVELRLSRDFSVRTLDSGEEAVLLSDEDVKGFRERTEQLGVHICAVLTACDFSAGDAESNIAWIARAIEIAGLLGAPSVRIDSAMSKERELDFETRVGLFVEGLGGAIERTPDSPVTLGIENHGFQGNNVVFLLNVFQQVGSPRLGSTLDAGNFYWRGYPLSEVYGIYHVLAPYTKHTHVKNINYPEDQREVTREAGWEYGTYSCPLDEGNIDLSKFVSILASAGYSGSICIEDESVGKCATPAERIAVLERNVAHLKGILGAVR